MIINYNDIKIQMIKEKIRKTRSQMIKEIIKTNKNPSH